jgi:hypothetical protein
MIFKCLNCKKDFSSNKSDKNRTPKYCSRICYSKREIPKETRQKQAKAKIGKIPWNKGKNMWDTRPHPKGTLGKKGIGKGKKVSEETRKKQREVHLGKKLLDRTGEKHHFWKGGITSETNKARKCIEYKIWRRSVFERDKFTCQICKKIGGYLQADHILPFSTHKENRFNIENGRTLCLFCHRKTETYGGKMHRKRDKE